MHPLIVQRLAGSHKFPALSRWGSDSGRPSYVLGDTLLIAQGGLDGVIISYDKRHVTRDGWKSWTTANTGTLFVNAITVSGDVWIEVGDYGRIGGGTFSGASKSFGQLYPVGYTYTGSIVAVSLSANFGLLIAEYYGVCRTLDGAGTWSSPISTGASFGMLGASVSGDKAVLVGYSGSIVFSANYGATWSLVTSGTTQTLRSVSLSGSNGVAVGDGGTILVTGNAGATWSPVTSGTTQTLRSVSLSGSNGAAVGDGGTFLVTRNAGATWSQMAVQNLANFRSVSVNSNIGAAVSNSGLITTY